MIVRAPAAMAARNGTSSRSRSSSSVDVDHRQRQVRVLRGVAVSGEVLGARPRRPPTAGRASRPRLCRATSSGVEPKLRTPMTGLSGLELMSASGARLRLHAGRAQFPAHPAAPPLGERGVAEAAEHSVARVRRPVVVVEAGDVAALLVDRDDRVRVGRVDRIRQLPQLPARDDVRAEEADPAEPSRSRSASHAGSVVPTKPGRRVAATGGGAGPRSQAGLGQSATPAHPLTAPPTSPLVIRPCTIRKKTMTGTATSVEAAITWPQSVARVALGWMNPRSHSGRVWCCSSCRMHQRDGELVPGLQERVHAGGDEPGGQQREGDPQERLGAAEAVHHRRLLEVDGDPGDEAAQHPDRERHHGGDVDDADADDGVQQVQRADHLVLGDEQPLGGQHLDQQHRQHEERAAAEPEPADRERGEEREDEAEHHGDQRDRHAHPERREERAVGRTAGEVVERAAEREELRGGASASTALGRKDEFTIQ